MKCKTKLRIEDSGAIWRSEVLCTCTCAASQIARRLSTVKNPESRFTLPPQSLTVCQSWGYPFLGLSVKTEKQWVLLISAAVGESQSFHPFTPAQGYRRGKEGVTGVVLIELCLDDKFSNSEWQSNFFQVYPNRIIGYPWYYSWRKQSLLGKVSSCWVRRPLGLWNANKERSSRLDEKICHEIGSPEGQKALTIAASFAVVGSAPKKRLINILNANIRFNCWRRQIFVKIHVLIYVFIAKSPSFPQMWCEVIRTTISRK